MQQWTDIRRRVLAEGVSKRQILRETGMHWTTLEKILSYSLPPGYRIQKLRLKPKLGPYVDDIRQILILDKQMPKKQRHTAKRILERLQEKGYTGGYSVVKEAVAELKRTNKEVFMPLVHRPGEGQVDYFHALVKMAGHLKKVAIFLIALPHSDAFFMMCTPRECTESFWEGHVRAFAFFGGVPARISYDNSRVAVSEIIGVHRRKLTDGFLELASHHLFEYHFCTIRRPNEKGVVEGTGKYARRNFMVPVPEVADYDELNAYLLDRCNSDLLRRPRSQSRTKLELLEDDRAAFLPIPPGPFDACRKTVARASSLSVVRFRSNNYSVPVEICHRNEQIASHRRLWGKGETVYEPRHYLPLLKSKPGALDHGLPLKDLHLPECFAILRRRLENEHGRQGTKDFIAVLRLLEKHTVKRVATAIDKALSAGVTAPDVIGMYLYPDLETEPGTFILDNRPQLKAVTVAQPRINTYGDLLEVTP